jgi:hypothetical protein
LALRGLVIVAATHRGGSHREVEAESRLGTGSEAYRAELICVFVDPRAGDAEVASQLTRIHESRRCPPVGRLIPALLKQVRHAASYLLDRIGRELGKCAPRPRPARPCCRPPGWLI